LSRIFARLLPLILFFHFFPGSAGAQQPNGPPNLNLGDAVVTGFSGTIAPDPAKPRPANKSAVDLTFINPDGPSARIVGVSRPGFVWDGRLLPTPRTFDVFAKDVGQVFGVALDDQQPASNIYLAATSAFGLNLISRGADGQPERRKTGGPGAGWMKGQFGLDLQGDPGSIYKVDGATGVITLFAKVMLDGVPNPGAALGNLAYDAAHKQLFVSDLYTGMIHRLAVVDGGEPGAPYDHGVTGRSTANLPPMPFNPANRPNIANNRFNSENPDSWGFAPPERRVWGVAVQAGRLYYSARNGSATDGPQIWSVGIAQDGSFAADTRLEVEVAAQPGPYPVSDIAFSQSGAMILAQRAPIAASYDYSAFTRPGEPRVLRYWLKDANDPPSPGLWKPLPEEYAIGFAGTYRNTDGGVALGYGYGPDGMINTGTCDAALWTTGQNLRNNPALRSQLEPGGPLLVNGLQGSPADMVRNGNEPPAISYFVDYDDTFDDPRASGHMGSVRILVRPCAGQVAGGPGSPGSGSSPPYVSGPQTPTTTPGCVGPNCYPPPITPVNIAIKKTAGAVKFDDKTGLWTVDFKIDVSNAGNPFAPGNSISISDPIPSGMTFVSTAGTNWGSCTPTAGILNCSYNFGTGVFNTGAYLNQLILTFTIKDPGKYENCATTAVAPGSGFTETSLADNRSCDSIEVKPTPVNIAIKKTAGAVTSDEKTGLWTVQFKVDVSNAGNPFAPGSWISISDPIPAGMTFVSAAGINWSPCTPTAGILNCSYNFGTGMFNTGAHLNQLIVTFTIKDPGKYENCATTAVAAGHGLAETTLADNRSCDTVVIVRRLDVAIVKTGVKVTVADMPVPGVTNFTFTLAMTNVGAGFTGNNAITVTDVVPAGMTFTSGTTGLPDWDCGLPGQFPILAGGTLTCSYVGSGPAAAGASLGSITIKATAKGDGPWTNCADVGIAAATGVDVNPADNHSCIKLTKDGFVPHDPPPPVNAKCGVNVLFVVDMSGSISNPPDGSGDHTGQVLAALNAAKAVFNNNGSQSAEVFFNGTAPPTFGPPNRPFATGTYNLLTTGYSPSGGTNWQAAMKAADNLLPFPNTIMFFITDGNPDVVLDSSGNPINTDDVTATNAAAPYVTSIYNKGVPIIGMGIGSAVDLTHLTALLGGNVYQSSYGGLAGQITNVIGPMICGDIYLGKSVDRPYINYYVPNPPPMPAQQVTITLKATNASNAPLSNIHVYDALPPELTAPIVLGTPPPGDNAVLSGTTVDWTIAALAAGASTQFTFNVTVSPTTIPTDGSWHCINNYAQIYSIGAGTVASHPGNMASQVNGPVHENDESVAQVCVQNHHYTGNGSCTTPTLQVTKVLPNNQETCTAGGPCSFDITVTPYCPPFSGPVLLGDGITGSSGAVNTPITSITTAGSSPAFNACPWSGAWSSTSTPTSCLANPVTLAAGQYIKLHVTVTAPQTPGNYTNCFISDGLAPPAANSSTAYGSSTVHPVSSPGPQGTYQETWGNCAQFTVYGAKPPPHGCVAPMVAGPTPGVCVCPQGTVRQGEQCARTCPPGMHLVNGVCEGPPPPGCILPLVPGPIPGVCVCPAGTVQQGRECVKQPACTAPMIPEGPGGPACVCPPGTVQKGKECVKQPVCEPPHILLGGQCICPPGTLQSGKECVKLHTCTPPMIPGPADQCICPPGTVQKGKECVKQETCKPPMVPGPGAGVAGSGAAQCVCPKGTVQQGRRCVPPIECRSPLIPNAAGTDCVCRPGLVQKGRTCVEPVVCNPPARLNRDGACQCPRDMVAKGNSCVERDRRPPTGTYGVPPRGRDTEPPRGGGKDTEPPRGGGRDNDPPRGGQGVDLPGRR
jgi:uncharacterized repeat protein (TIGR01451 family)